MARRRISAARRRERDEEAQIIAAGVYAIVLELKGAGHDDAVLPLGLTVTAPLMHAADTLASAVCRHKQWTGEERHEQVSQFLFHGLSESVVALVDSFDEDYFQRWTEALKAAAG